MERVDTWANLLKAKAFKYPGALAQVLINGVSPGYTLFAQLAAFSGKSPVPPDFVALQNGLAIDGRNNGGQAAADDPGKSENQDDERLQEGFAMLCTDGRWSYMVLVRDAA
ncbi:kinase-like protein [Zalerion maritima]|uniref:Kinase-like protein n=1 Tax=Zalerion maritima TaxID=339359 RepID=A0AAD5RVY8_9PEZI|nr:kinase-like protein [Zalerion maritima]